MLPVPNIYRLLDKIAPTVLPPLHSSQLFGQALTDDNGAAVRIGG